MRGEPSDDDTAARARRGARATAGELAGAAAAARAGRAAQAIATRGRAPAAAAAAAIATWGRVPAVAAAAAAIATWGCVPAASAPLRTVAYGHAGGAAADTLLVLLPGRGDRAETFAAEGFVDAARAADPRVDVVAADAHIGYYLRNVIVDRLWEDVVVPARARGYARVWLAGISMGGLGAVAFARAHPDAVAGLCLLAPYLGDDVVAEVRRAGGLARWRPSGAPDDFARLWLFLKGYTAGAPGLPALWLGYGRSDRFAAAHDLLAAALPADHVLRADGGHDWPPWRALWAQFLARRPLHPDGA
ncbi:MAG TPA: alpha/beta hydrolase [Myxococcota bacterium]|jgi:pimeloyl-ACP methyl ester carboxylesterase|nr:alpha/beta hydrolase [Myxococcota bacterium]